MPHSPSPQKRAWIQKLEPVPWDRESNPQVDNHAPAPADPLRESPRDLLSGGHPIADSQGLDDIAKIGEGRHTADVASRIRVVQQNQPPGLQLTGAGGERRRDEPIRGSPHREGVWEHPDTIPPDKERQIHSQMKRVAAAGDVVAVGFFAKPVVKAASPPNLQRAKGEAVRHQEPRAAPQVRWVDGTDRVQEEVGQGIHRKARHGNRSRSRFAVAVAVAGRGSPIAVADCVHTRPLRGNPQRR